MRETGSLTVAFLYSRGTAQFSSLYELVTTVLMIAVLEVQITQTCVLVLQSIWLYKATHQRTHLGSHHVPVEPEDDGWEGQ